MRRQSHRTAILIVSLLVLVIFAEAGLLFFDRGLLGGIPAFPKDCLGKPDGYEGRWVCLNPYFSKLTKATSANVALTKALELTKQGVISDCHISAHTIGAANLEKYDFDLGTAFASCGFHCIQGCMHGAMERYIQNKGDPYAVRDEIKTVCDSVAPASLEAGSPTPSRETLLWRQCYHGIGHGLLQHGFFSLEDSVDICREFDDAQAEWRCIGGVMMENANQYLALDENSLLNALPKVCAPLEKLKDSETTYNAWFACMDDLALGLMFYTGHDTRRSQELCEGLLQESDINLCKDRVVNTELVRNPEIMDIPFR